MVAAARCGRTGGDPDGALGPARHPTGTRSASATIQSNGTPTRIGPAAFGIRLRHGVSAEEIFELLAYANRQFGVRVNSRQLAAVAMEIRHWYRNEQDDPAGHHWPVTYTSPDTEAG
jgi:hypothetical protein